MSEGRETSGLRWSVGRIWGEIRSRLSRRVGAVPEAEVRGKGERRPDVGAERKERIGAVRKD